MASRRHQSPAGSRHSAADQKAFDADEIDGRCPASLEPTSRTVDVEQFARDQHQIMQLLHRATIAGDT